MPWAPAGSDSGNIGVDWGRRQSTLTSRTTRLLVLVLVLACHWDARMRECEKDVKDGWLGRNAIVGHDDYEHEHEHEHR